MSMNYKNGTPKIPSLYKDGTPKIPGFCKDGTPRKDYCGRIRSTWTPRENYWDKRKKWKDSRFGSKSSRRFGSWFDDEEEDY